MSAIQPPREIVLPWPSRLLHPNTRVHYMPKSRAAKKSKLDAQLVALAAGWKGIRMGTGRLHVWIDGYPTDKRRRDEDGLLSSLKWALDGIAEVMGIDDSRFIPHPWIKDSIVKGGEVRIRITSSPQIIEQT